MFTNEKAALKVANSFYLELRKKNIKRFLDPDFGPKDINDSKGSANSLYIDGVVP